MSRGCVDGGGFGMSMLYLISHVPSRGSTAVCASPPCNPSWRYVASLTAHKGVACAAWHGAGCSAAQECVCLAVIRMLVGPGGGGAVQLVSSAFCFDRGHLWGGPGGALGRFGVQQTPGLRLRGHCSDQNGPVPPKTGGSLPWAGGGGSRALRLP